MPRTLHVLLPGFAALALCSGPALAQQPPAPAGTAPPPGQVPQAQPPAQAAPPYPYPYPQPYGQPYPCAYPYYPYPYTYPQPYPYPTTVGPARIPYEEGQLAPAGYRLGSETRTDLVIGGAVTLGTFWGMSLLTAIVADGVRNAGRDRGEQRDDGAMPLFIPVIGPFIAISTMDSEGAGTSLLLIDGLAQGAGAAMLVAGITAKRKVWIRQVGGVQLQLAPVALGSRGAALGLDGRF